MRAAAYLILCDVEQVHEVEGCNFHPGLLCGVSTEDMGVRMGEESKGDEGVGGRKRSETRRKERSRRSKERKGFTHTHYGPTISK